MVRHARLVVQHKELLSVRFRTMTRVSQNTQVMEDAWDILVTIGDTVATTDDVEKAREELYKFTNMISL